MADNKNILKKKCKSGRFENYRNCQDVSVDEKYCQHHIEIYEFF